MEVINSYRVYFTLLIWIYVESVLNDCLIIGYKILCDTVAMEIRNVKR